MTKMPCEIIHGRSLLTVVINIDNTMRVIMLILLHLYFEENYVSDEINEKGGTNENGGMNPGEEIAKFLIT